MDEGATELGARGEINARKSTSLIHGVPDGLTRPARLVSGERVTETDY